MSDVNQQNRKPDLRPCLRKLRNIPVNPALAGISLRETIMKLSGNSKTYKRGCGKCASIYPRKIPSVCWIHRGNQMDGFNQSKQSASFFFHSFLLSFIPSFFKFINLFIKLFKSGQRIFINKFNKAMKEKMKLESRPDTLIAGDRSRTAGKR